MTFAGAKVVFFFDICKKIASKSDFFSSECRVRQLVAMVYTSLKLMLVWVATRSSCNTTHYSTLSPRIKIRRGPRKRLIDGLLMLSMVGATLPAAPSVRKQKSIAFSMLLTRTIAVLAVLVNISNEYYLIKALSRAWEMLIMKSPIFSSSLTISK